MRAVLCLSLLLALAAPQIDPSRIDAPLPDPTQTFNLWFHLVKVGKIEGALALVLDDAITDGVRDRHDRFSTMAKDRGFRLVGFDKIVQGKLAVVLLLDHSAEKKSIDIDPCYFLARKGVWQVLPTFGGLEGEPLDYLSEEEKRQLEGLQEEFNKKKEAAKEALKKELGK